MELLRTLGIDWRLLIAQIVNFLILMGVLYFVLFKPVTKALESRRTRIAESLENADKIGAELKRTGEEQARIVAEARREAQKIVNEAELRAEKTRDAVLEKARAEVSAIIKQSKTQIAADREELMHEVRVNAAELITAAAERVIGEKLTAAKDRAMIEGVLERM
jgi:F-type H+-transporting ATPase subunit b